MQAFCWKLVTLIKYRNRRNEKYILIIKYMNEKLNTSSFPKTWFSCILTSVKLIPCKAHIMCRQFVKFSTILFNVSFFFQDNILGCQWLCQLCQICCRNQCHKWWLILCFNKVKVKSNQAVNIAIGAWSVGLSQILGYGTILNWYH